ncbi:hypothetical protein FORC13_p185 (plasmid) [Bacillus cereus]|uniref:hypothetical protein n=1 Tax=Bacillus cereus group TaxID=86661 RepID=UPI0007449E4F|nr:MULTISPECIES: hypothetical protein [Bacillus cereus group]ALZ64670.1 hypothetical protein FORC13_p185 [Bacillus cereus]MEC2393794.1 hypothetical protein [Bacillus toyonensis]OTX33664.1 hypothetical protein BK717_18125 [Bacillus thuringiensis serovar malayensis]OUB08520.1 hypothetical protein BK709_09085 [Bacillus thuringiensis serovar shandongiensis]
MGKSFIIRNQRSLNGQSTNAVLVTLKSWQKLVETFEEKYYSYKDTFLEDIVDHMTYEERIADVDGFMEKAKPSFSRRTPSTISETIGRKHKLYGITNADLEVFLYLHKKCYTNGVIPNVTVHMLWEDYKQYKEEFAYIQHSQFYIALKKLTLHNIATIEKELDGRYTIKLTHFMNEETEKANPYVYISPAVFTKDFFELSVAAKKLFLDIAMQQHRETTLKRSLDKQDERGNKTHFGGMYRFLHKKYPHQIRAVMTELTTSLRCTGTPLFKICKLQKGVNNKKRYTTLYLSLHADFLCTKEAGEVQYRDPFTPKTTYARKARFIESVLQEMHIGEFTQDMNKFIHVLKYTCHRQIRSVIHSLRDMIDRNEEYPSKLVYTLKKLLNQTSQYQILDTAAKEGIYPLITQHVSKEKKEQAVFDFGLHFSMYSLRNIKRLFRKTYELLKYKFAVPVTEESYHRNYLKYQEETLFRKYAFEQGTNLNAYIALEIEIRELLKARGHKDRLIPSDVRELFIEKIDRLPKEKLRVIEVPGDFNLITFMRAFEKLIRSGIQVATAEQVLEVLETN